MDNKRTRVAYFAAIIILVILLAFLGMRYKDAPIIVEGA